MTPALPGEAPDPSATPALHALLKEVEADTATVDNHLVEVGFTMKAHDRNADRAPRLAAMLRVAVEALGFYESGSRNAFRCNNERLDPAKGTGPCCERVIDAGGIAQDALARIEAMAKGEE